MTLGSKESGLTIVEILVALVLGLFLTTGILSVYLGSKQTYRAMEAVSRSQEDGRYAFDLLGRTVRMAGFIGCTRLGDSNLNINDQSGIDQPDEFGQDTFIRGEDDLGSGEDVGGRQVTEDTDTITIRGGAGSSSLVRSNVDPSAGVAVRVYRNADGWVAGDVLMISDCSNVDIFPTTRVNPVQAGVNIRHNEVSLTSSHIYLKDAADVMSYIDTTYFISGCENPEDDAPPCLALWRFERGRGLLEEVLEGIHDMQILYGVGTGGAPGLDRYQTAAEVTASSNWGRVVAVRIALLLVSAEDNLVDSPQAVPFNGALLEPDDHRLRRVETSMIAIRNRLP